MLRKLLVLTVVVGCATLAVPPVVADWIPEDGHKMHYPQFPDEAGWDVNATQPLVLADDWMCSETGWVKDVHFWGSWMHGVEGQVLYFVLSIHEDIPANPPEIPYSRPGATLWEREITNFIPQPIDPPAMEGWYDPATGQFFTDDHQAYFQYNVFLEEQDWFWQEEGRIYWLNISAVLEDPAATQWGWKSTQDHWNDDAVWAFWGELFWIDMWEPPDFLQSLDLSFVITGGTDDTCEYYKPPYPDYSPQGMPDFDQKQSNWWDANNKWSHDGPAALANCLWWFDSKFEPNPVDPRPFGVTPANDNYPLLAPYGPWDDHDTANVQPFVTDLATNYTNTNPGGVGGTTPWDLQTGFRNYLSVVGLTGQYRDTFEFLPTYDYIKAQVLDCQDVILYLSFYEDMGTHWSYLGSHYVTTAGVCTDPTKRQLCISDPYLDALEGEPPAGSAHGGTVHNDADNISGPHSQIHHDPYQLTPMIPPGGTNPVEVINYPITPGIVNNFTGMNVTVDFGFWQGGTVYTAIDNAWVICPDTAVDTCEYYKDSYGDYAPNGVPDFDQKQDNWISPFTGNWSWCGPVALANCFWWFDSKFEPNPVDPRPFYPGPGNPPLNDGYPLVSSYDPSGIWDDHDTNNVMPFISQLGTACNVDNVVPGTMLSDLDLGVHNWLNMVGLGGTYTTYVVLGPEFEEVKDSILSCQDVILLIGFYEILPTGDCQWLGGHYVTAAGVCTTVTDICVSDPMFDANEGEPPAGAAHGSWVHNDAFFVSGPHGTNDHDRYNLQPNQWPCPSPATWEFTNYPTNWPDIMVFENENPLNPMPPVTYQGSPIVALLDAALIICPAEPPPSDTVKCEPQGGVNPTHPPTYWYDVTPGGSGGRCDFHVKVFDSIAAHYTNWVEPAGWTHAVHKVGSDWWVSWWSPGCTNAIFSTFRFQYDNQYQSVWSDWVTTQSGTNDPTLGGIDSTANHTTDPDGYGYRVHVPFYEEQQPPDTCDYYKARYEDYAPNGVPDFDQKQNAWILPGTGQWSHCGPVALANCFWWFDSKFEPNPVDPRPFWPSAATPPANDGYPLAQSYDPAGVWDDHDTNNVLFFVDSLAKYCRTNLTVPGTFIHDFILGVHEWMDSMGVLADYEIMPMPGDIVTYDFIRDEVMRSEDLILLLGFWEDQGGNCIRVGGHYVTVAGVCDVDQAICISDPYFDMHEGEPPIGVHPPGVHNDAFNISGPHGTIYHDKYFLGPPQLPCVPPYLEVYGYPMAPPDIFNFMNLNDGDIPSGPYGGGPIFTLIEYIVDISPCCRYRGNVDHIIGIGGPIDVADLSYLVDYLFKGGPPPPCPEEGNVDGLTGPGGPIDVADLSYLVNYLFQGGPPPPPCP